MAHTPIYRNKHTCINNNKYKPLVHIYAPLHLQRYVLHRDHHHNHWLNKFLYEYLTFFSRILLRGKTSYCGTARAPSGTQMYEWGWWACSTGYLGEGEDQQALGPPCLSILPKWTLPHLLSEGGSQNILKSQILISPLLLPYFVENHFSSWSINLWYFKRRMWGFLF